MKAEGLETKAVRKKPWPPGDEGAGEVRQDGKHSQAGPW